MAGIAAPPQAIFRRGRLQLTQKTQNLRGPHAVCKSLVLTYNLRLLFLSSLFPLFFYEKNGPQIAKQGERSQEYNLRSLFQVRFVLLKF
jgi:hypothetical protein